LVELPSNERMKFFLLSFFAGILTIVLWLPSYKIFLIITEIKSFWIQMPTLEVYTSLFKEFFGSAETVVFIAFLLSLFYFIKLFQEKKGKNNLFIQNKKIFSFIIISIWIFVTLLIPYIRTYLDIPMIISRYFISVLPATILILAIAIAEINSKAIQRIVVIIFVIVSLIDVIIVKDYYNKISKTQYREMTQKIIEKNKSNAIIVSTWGWHLRYFFTNDVVKMETKEQTLQEFVDNMKQNPTQARDFWFLGAHFQTYQLTPDAEDYLNSYFNLVESLEFYDTWAKYYVSKTNKKLMTKPTAKNELNLSLFSPIQLDGNGNLNLFENTSIKSDFIALEKGNYNLIISGMSKPEKPINGENAHLRIQLNGEEIASFYLSENRTSPTKIISFNYNKNEDAQFQLIYDNDVFENGNDRNAIIYSIALKNKDK
jgi:hypothetical protein